MISEILFGGKKDLLNSKRGLNWGFQKATANFS